MARETWGANTHRDHGRQSRNEWDDYGQHHQGLLCWLASMTGLCLETTGVFKKSRASQLHFHLSGSKIKVCKTAPSGQLLIAPLSQPPAMLPPAPSTPELCDVQGVEPLPPASACQVGSHQLLPKLARTTLPASSWASILEDADSGALNFALGAIGQKWLASYVTKRSATPATRAEIARHVRARVDVAPMEEVMLHFWQREHLGLYPTFNAISRQGIAALGLDLQWELLFLRLAKTVQRLAAHGCGGVPPDWLYRATVLPAGLAAGHRFEESWLACTERRRIALSRLGKASDLAAALGGGLEAVLLEFQANQLPLVRLGPFGGHDEGEFLALPGYTLEILEATEVGGGRGQRRLRCAVVGAPCSSERVQNTGAARVPAEELERRAAAALGPRVDEAPLRRLRRRSDLTVIEGPGRARGTPERRQDVRQPAPAQAPPAAQGRERAPRAASVGPSSAASWALVGERDVRAPDDATAKQVIRGALRAWAAAQRPVQKVKELSQPRLQHGDTWVTWAKCRMHEDCPYRYKAILKSGERLQVWGAHGPHAVRSAIVRKTKVNPPLRHDQLAGLRAAFSQGPCGAVNLRKRPFDAGGELIGTPAEYPPGKAARALKYRMTAAERGKPSALDTQGLLDYCNSRRVDLSLGVRSPVPEDQSSMSFLATDVRPGHVSLVWTFWSFVRQLAAFARQHADDLGLGFCGTTDATRKVVWQGYVVGCLGVVFSRRALGGSLRRWRHAVLPVVFHMSPVENEHHYAQMLQWGSEVVRVVLAQCEARIPTPLWRQVCSDWSTSAAKVFRPPFVARHPRDYEHAAANCRRNLPTNALGRPLNTWLRVMRLAMYAWTTLLSSALYRAFMRVAREQWGGSEFVKYFFRARYVKEVEVEGERFVITPMYSGGTSKLQVGFPASQQYIEGLFGNLKSAAEVANQHNNVVRFLGAQQQVVRQWIHTPGYEHSLIGPHQELRAIPAPPELASEDLLRGSGRAIKVAGRVRTHPTVKTIVAAHSVTRGLSIASIGEHRVLHAWAARPSAMPMPLAVSAVRMLGARSNAEVEAIWRQSEVGILATPEGSEAEVPDLDRAEAVLGGLALVRVKEGSLPSCLCDVFRTTGECAHALAICQLELNMNVVGGQTLPRAPGAIEPAREGRPPQSSGGPALVRSDVAAAKAASARAQASSRRRRAATSSEDERASEQPLPECDAFVVPADLESAQPQLFATANGCMSLVFWLGSRDHPARVEEVLQTTHMAHPDGVAITAESRGQLMDRLVATGPSLIGWCLWRGQHARHPTLSDLLVHRELWADSPHLVFGIAWSRGVESMRGLTLWRVRVGMEHWLERLEARSQTASAISFLEPVPFVKAPGVVVRTTLGRPRTKGAAAPAPSEPPARSSTIAAPEASLERATASALLSHLREVAEANKTMVLPASLWLDNAPIAGVARTPAQMFAALRTSLKVLKDNGQVTLHWGARSHSDLQKLTVILKGQGDGGNV